MREPSTCWTGCTGTERRPTSRDEEQCQVSAEEGLHEYINTRHPEILETIRDTGDLPEDELKNAVTAFVKTIVTVEEEAETEEES